MSDAQAALHEAFSLGADPAAYVPSPARERALGQLRAALEAGAVPCLEGPTGIGKTLLLQLLALRLGDRFELLYLPYPALSTSELCVLALGLLGREVASDPEAALQRLAGEHAEHGRPLVLLIDDAASLPADTARGLAGLLAASGGALRAVLAGLGGEALLHASAPFGDTLLRVALEEGIPEGSLRDYVAAQLELAQAPASLRAAFDDAALAELGRAAAGNPRLLHLAAQGILRRMQTVSADAATGEARAREAVVAHASAGPERVVAPVAEALPAPAPAPAAEPIAAQAAVPEPDVVPAPVAARESPATPPPFRGEPTPPPRPPPIEAEPLGEYRIVRGRAVLPPAPAAPAPPSAASPELPSDIDWTLAPLLEVANRRRELGTPATALHAPAPVAPAPIVVTRRGPSLALVAGVALVSAALGFGLAARLESAGLGLGSWLERSSQPEYPVTPPPAEPPVAVTTPAPPPPEPPPPPAEIEVSINATPWAIVEVDGRELGETPLGAVKLQPGSYRFRARFPDGRVDERVVEIDSEHRTLVFE